MSRGLMNDRARPVLFWFRRDLRLTDHPGLVQAAASGAPVIPIFILDPETEAIGAASRWRLDRALDVFGRALAAGGSRLILRRGPAAAAIRALIAETGARAVHWQRLYDPVSRQRDQALKAALRADGIEAVSHPGHLLHEPWDIETRQGGHFKVYTPFWRAASARDPGTAPAAPRLPAPETWPRSDDRTAWRLGAAMHRGAAVVAEHAVVGEAAARDRLEAFLDGPIGRYDTERDRPDRNGTSRLSENLTWGEIGPRTVWQAAIRAGEAGAAGAETFRKELIWRDFAWHLLYHTPELASRNWRAAWDAFPWSEDAADAQRWQRGITGEPIIDAGIRQMHVTGTMHNRVRMLVASYLTKHMLVHWKIGCAWFAEHLIDWDPASNAMGWQWAAGSGPDAAPYFRIFNPATQAEKFDPDGAYRRRYLRGWAPGRPAREAEAFFEAVPRAWGLSPDDPYPDPMLDLKQGRKRALAAYQEAFAKG